MVGMGKVSIDNITTINNPNNNKYWKSQSRKNTIIIKRKIIITLKITGNLIIINSKKRKIKLLIIQPVIW